MCSVHTNLLGEVALAGVTALQYATVLVAAVLSGVNASTAAVPAYLVVLISVRMLEARTCRAVHLQHCRLITVMVVTVWTYAVAARYSGEDLPAVAATLSACLVHWLPTNLLWWPAAGVSLRSLQKAAANVEKQCQAKLREVCGPWKVRCTYLGQWVDGQYAASPKEWTQLASRSDQEYVWFQWILPSGEKELQKVRADNAVRQGVPSHERVDGLIFSQELAQRAAEACQALRKELKTRRSSLKISCKCSSFRQ